jgi:hypothetical protein
MSDSLFIGTSTKRLRHLVFCLSLALLMPRLANGMTVFDENHILPDLNHWMGPSQPFDQALQCGQNASFDVSVTHCDIRCTKGFCVTRCEASENPVQDRFKLFVDECSADEAHIFGENGLIMDITRTKYDAEGGHWIMPFLEQLGQFIQPEGEVHLIEHWPHDVNYIDAGKMRRLRAREIRGELRFADSAQSESIQLLVTNELDGVRQILKCTLGDHDVLMQLRGVTEGRPK